MEPSAWALKCYQSSVYNVLKHNNGYERGISREYTTTKLVNNNEVKGVSSQLNMRINFLGINIPSRTTKHEHKFGAMWRQVT